MPEFANDDDTFAIPRRPSIGWFKQVCAAAGVWPDAETVPDAVWNAVLRYQEAMRKVQGSSPQQTLAEAHRAFLEYAKREGLPVDRTTSPGLVSYFDPVTRAAWRAFQAGLSKPPVQGSQP